jgi:16S rRNA pseudouridine516 synthase
MTTDSSLSTTNKPFSLPKPSKQRVDRILSNRGLGHRKSLQRMIKYGDICAIDTNGEKQIIQSESETFFENQIFELSFHQKDNQEPIIEKSEPLPLLVAFHKPMHLLCTVDDPWGRKGIDSVLPTAWRLGHLHPVGRLDSDTTGLLLFSSLGTLTQYLLHPKRQMPRTYLATVENIPDDLAQRIQEGVATALGEFSGKIQKIDLEKKQVEIEVTEGKYRMVRRMLHNAGASVIALHRIRYAQIELGDLPVSQFRILSHQELQSLGIIFDEK